MPCRAMAHTCKLNRGFDDALTELVINDRGILGNDGDVYEGGRRVCIFEA